ncbi:MAG: hydantoinase B/oxoprolinase family protein, partial [Planctomycetota bacterium]
TVSAVFYVLRLLLGRDAPTNDGLLRRAQITTRTGTVVDACYPAAVAAGNVETSQRLVDVLLACFAQIFGEECPAGSAGTMTNVTFGSPPQAAADGRFTYYETLGGGAGGGPAGAGAHALQTHMTNTRNTPIESFERELPVRVLEQTVRRKSGGRGAQPGGDGIRRRLQFLEPASAAWIADRQRRGPAGLEGGEDGQPGRIAVRWPGEKRARAQAGKAACDLPAGSELELETPGGGGFGTPE